MVMITEAEAKRRRLEKIRKAFDDLLFEWGDKKNFSLNYRRGQEISINALIKILLDI